MKTRIKLFGKEYVIKAYNSAQEKELLLLATQDDFTIYDICDILNFDYTGLSDEEIIYIIYMHRNLSLGEDNIEFMFDCKSCFQINNIITGTDFLTEATRNDVGIKKLKKPISKTNVNEFFDIDALNVESIDDLDLDIYFDLLSKIDSNIDKINFKKEFPCPSCGKKYFVDFSKCKFLISSLSEESIESIYDSYSGLVYHGNFTKLDIDSFYPFERNIFISMLNKKLQKMNSGA